MFVLVVEGKGAVVGGRQAWRGVGGEGGGGGGGGGQDCWTASVLNPCVAVLFSLNPMKLSQYFNFILMDKILRPT